MPRWPVWAVIGAAITGLQRRMHARKLVSCQRHPNGVCLLCGSVVLLALVAMQCVCIGTVTSYLCTMLTVAVTLLRCEGCVQIPCQAGKWSATAALGSPCSLDCAAGYVCAAGSQSPAPQECGGPQYYCPQGSGSPLTVSAGYYSAGGQCPVAYALHDGAEARTSMHE